MSKKNQQNRTVIKKDKFIQAMAESYGNISDACKFVEINRSTYYDWMEKDADFKEKISNVVEESIDFVESQLISNIKKGDTTSIIFFLKTRAKNRGYTEKQEIQVSELPDGFETTII